MNRSVNRALLPAGRAAVQQSDPVEKPSRFQYDGAVWEGIMRKVIAALACAVLLAGCASASGTMLSGDTALISAEGNGASDRDKIIRDVLAEAARLTSAQGYRYFVVLTADDLTRTETLKRPGPTFYNQSPAPGRTFGTLSGRLFQPDSPYTTPDLTVERVIPALDIMIRMYREGEIEPAEGVFDATAMLSSPSP